MLTITLFALSLASLRVSVKNGHGKLAFMAGLSCVAVVAGSV